MKEFEALLDKFQLACKRGGEYNNEREIQVLREALRSHYNQARLEVLAAKQEFAAWYELAKKGKKP